MREPQLSSRLLQIRSLVPECETVCDVGTDHGLLPISLIIHGICEKCIASDINQGPLSRAEENAALYNMLDRFDLRLCDGLSKIKPKEAETIIIAGMGGELIASILEGNPDTARSAKTLVLSANSRVRTLRKFLNDNRYEILDERGISEENHPYLTIVCRYNEKIEPEERDNLYLSLGEVITKRLDKTDREYLKEVRNRAQTVIDGIKRSKRKDESLEKLGEYTDVVNEITRVLAD